MFITSAINPFRQEAIQCLMQEKKNTLLKNCVKKIEDALSSGSLTAATLASILHIATVSFAFVATSTGVYFFAVVLTGLALASLAIILAVAAVILRIAIARFSKPKVKQNPYPHHAQAFNQIVLPNQKLLNIKRPCKSLDSSLIIPIIIKPTSSKKKSADPANKSKQPSLVLSNKASSDDFAFINVEPTSSQKSLKASVKEIEALKDKIDLLVSDKAKLQRDLDNKDSEIEKLQADLDAIREQSKSPDTIIERTLDEFKKRHSRTVELEKKIGELQQKNSILENECTIREQSIANLEKDCTSYQDKLKITTHSLQCALEEKGKLEKQLATMQQKLEILEKDLDSKAQAEIALVDTIHELTETQDKNIKQIKELEMNVEGLKKLNETLIRENIGLKDNSSTTDDILRINTKDLTPRSTAFIELFQEHVREKEEEDKKKQLEIQQIEERNQLEEANKRLQAKLATLLKQREEEARQQQDAEWVKLDPSPRDISVTFG